MAEASSTCPEERRHRKMRGLLLGGFVVIIGQLVWVQVVRREYYLHDIAPLLVSHAAPLGPEPGAILARDGQPLAQSVLIRSLIASPRRMLQRGDPLEVVADQLAPILKRPSQDIYAQLSRDTNSQNVELKRAVTEDVAQQVRELKVSGLALRPEWRREYPQRTLACHVLGGRDRFHRPLSGLEHQFRVLLDPRAGSNDMTRRGPAMPGEEQVQPRPGKDLLLTLDPALQRQLDMELDRVYARETPRWVSGVIVNPRNGEILAIGARPGYDPNAYVEGRRAPGYRWSAVPSDAVKNIPVTDALEQGSTFKILLVAAALDAGVIKPETQLHCGGHINIGGRPISCWGRYGATGHGTLDMYGMIGQSCNVIAAQVALRLGAPRYYAFLRKAGIGVDPEAGFPAEAVGLVARPVRIRDRDLATMGFGQNVSCSGLQLTAAVAGIVNAGIMEAPHIVGAVLNKDGSVFRQPRPESRRLCSAETSATVRRMLQYAVEHGTGAAVRMPDFRVGGKTGTAQQWDFEHGGHFTDRYLASFVEVAPIETPRYVIYIACNEPQVGEHGADVAAPACRNLTEFALRRLEPAALSGRAGARHARVGTRAATR